MSKFLEMMLEDKLSSSLGLCPKVFAVGVWIKAFHSANHKEIAFRVCGKFLLKENSFFPRNSSSNLRISSQQNFQTHAQFFKISRPILGWKWLQMIPDLLGTLFNDFQDLLRSIRRFQDYFFSKKYVFKTF